MWDEWPSAIRQFRCSPSESLLIVQLDPNWFSASNLRHLQAVEYELADLCVSEEREIRVFRVVPHTLSRASVDDPSRARIYGEWLESASTWLRFVPTSTRIITQRTIAPLLEKDRIDAEPAGGFNALDAAVVDRIIVGHEMTPIRSVDYELDDGQGDVDDLFS